MRLTPKDFAFLAFSFLLLSLLFIAVGLNLPSIAGVGLILLALPVYLITRALIRAAAESGQSN
ncbi:MAG: hypothetical protein ACRD6W_03890 [Nitrososphaerales archaeon]